MCLPLHIERSPDTLRTGLKPVPNGIPADNLTQGADPLAKSTLPDSIPYHSTRVFLVAQFLAQREESEWAFPERVHLLAVACRLHDIGCGRQSTGPNASRWEAQMLQQGILVSATFLRLTCTKSSRQLPCLQAQALQSTLRSVRFVRHTILLARSSKACGLLGSMLPHDQLAIHQFSTHAAYYSTIR
ncbi:hypothetical protein BJX61DRAFT_43381 [Aspergillus egyptiacus]|nr:hypothetical protein BJX61DRAFT_43381 [Aspergillus egyptiacus]